MYSPLKERRSYLLNLTPSFTPSLAAKGAEFSEVALSPEEERYSLLLKGRRRASFEYIHSWLHLLLQRECGLSATDCQRLFRSPNGKWQLPPSYPLLFTLAHTKGWAIFSFDAYPVGVDIELLGGRKRERALIEIAKRYFSQCEYSFITAERELSQERFFMLWTLKESYIKERGETLATSLRRVHFDSELEKIGRGSLFSASLNSYFEIQTLPLFSSSSSSSSLAGALSKSRSGKEEFLKESENSCEKLFLAWSSQKGGEREHRVYQIPEFLPLNHLFTSL